LYLQLQILLFAGCQVELQLQSEFLEQLKGVINPVDIVELLDAMRISEEAYHEIRSLITDALKMKGLNQQDNPLPALHRVQSVLKLLNEEVRTCVGWGGHSDWRWSDFCDCFAYPLE